jgi:hypothetical protein
MDDREKELFEKSVPLEDLPEEEIVNLAGYQVTKAELFSHTREPSITFWQNRLKFSMSCLRRFPGVKHIQIMVNPEERRMIIRPCDPDTPDCLRWATGGGEKEIKNRDMMCKVFSAKVFDMMKWDSQYRYKVLGKPVTCEGEFLFLFKLNDFELFVSGNRKGSYLPTEWRDYFGVPADKHDEEYKINLADGYITTDKV